MDSGVARHAQEPRPVEDRRLRDDGAGPAQPVQTAHRPAGAGQSLLLGRRGAGPAAAHHPRHVADTVR